MLKLSGVHILYGEASEGELIERISNEIEIIIPPSLLNFYLCFSYLEIGTDSLQWIDDLPVQNRILRERYPFLPREYIPIMEDGIGGHYFCIGRGDRIVTSDFGKVVFLVPFLRMEPEMAAETFEGFLESVIKRYEEDVCL